MTEKTSKFISTMTLAHSQWMSEIDEQLKSISEVAEEAKKQIQNAVDEVKEKSKKEIESLTERVNSFIQTAQEKQLQNQKGFEKSVAQQLSGIQMSLDAKLAPVEKRLSQLDEKIGKLNEKIRSAAKWFVEGGQLPS